MPSNGKSILLPYEELTKSPTGSASTVTHGTHLTSASYVGLQNFKKGTKETYLLSMISG